MQRSGAMTNKDLKIGDMIIWAYIPKKVAKGKNMEDSPEYVRLRNIEIHGEGPFKILDIAPHKNHSDKITLIEILDKNRERQWINKQAFKHKK